MSDMHEKRLRDIRGLAGSAADLIERASVYQRDLVMVIRVAHAEGVPVTEIARAANLSRPTVYRIIREGESK